MRLVLLSAVVLSSLLLTRGAAAELSVPRGFAPLFNGENLDGWHGRPHFDPHKLAAMPEDERNKTLDGWWQAATQYWTIENGELVNDGKGPYLTTDREYGDCELLIEYRTVAKADSGIYLRGNPQVQIWDWTREGGKWNRGADKGSGGLFNNAKRSPGQEPRVLADRPFGEWNAFRIRQVGARTNVWLNGKLVVDNALMENFWIKRKPLDRTGPIQLQTHGGEIRWRNLFIREIGVDESNQLLAAAACSSRDVHGHRVAGGLLERLATPVEINFDRTPLQEAIRNIAEQCGIAVMIDANALKMSGLTLNMARKAVGRFSAAGAFRSVLNQPPQDGPGALCLVCDDASGRLIVTTRTVAEGQGQTPIELTGDAPAGWKSVFNGDDLTGWQGDVDNYEVVDGAIVCKEGQGGNLLTKDEYADFQVQFEFRLPPGGNNGLAIRFPGEGRPHLHGMCELQVIDSEHEKYANLDARQYHGSAYGMVPAHRGFLRPIGQWNHQLVTVQGSKIKVELNGFVILDADLSTVTEFMGDYEHPGLKLKKGFFGFAGHNDPVAFRKIQIRELDPADEVATRTWPQFRGHNSSGRAVTAQTLPTKIEPGNAKWSIELPPGHSSPVVFEDRIYLTAVRDNSTLVTLALDRETGKVLWEKVAPHEKLEQIHQIGSYAQCTPATDGDIVVSMFGSSGLFAYDRDGNELWNLRMGPFNNEFGAGTSPIITGNTVILVQDHDTDSFLLAVDKRTGKELWRTDRSEFPRNYCSPILWETGGKQTIAVAATLRVVGYDVETGKEVWTVRGLSRAVCMTPVVGEDGWLYVAGWAQGGDVDSRITIPEWSTAAKDWDADGSGTLEEKELPSGNDIQRRFGQFDRDKTGSITEAEYAWYRDVFEVAVNRVIAIRPGGTGDLTESNVVWEYRKFLPFCSSPLATNGYVFLVKNGGIVTSLDGLTGEQIETGRVAGTGNYYASPVAGDNKVFLADEKGHVSVISSFAEWSKLHDVDFGEGIYGTPAIVNGRIYLRTNGHLYCFE
jgi:outer membrane protein assembly factor BamB